MATRAFPRTELSRRLVAVLIGAVVLLALVLVAAGSASARTAPHPRAHAAVRSSHRHVCIASAPRRRVRRAHGARARAACMMSRVRAAGRRRAEGRTAAAGTTQIGIVAWRTFSGAQTSSVGAKLVRMEFPIGASVDELRPAIASQASHGVRVLPMAAFRGRIPTPAESRNLATWAHAFGPGGTFWAGRPDGQFAVTRIEFGNETSYGYQYGDDLDRSSYVARAKAYALRVKDAQVAIQGDGGNPAVGILAQADDADAGPRWVNGMFSAVPDLGSRVAGWTIHAYGPDWKPRIDRLIQQTAAHGASSRIPIVMTEWGISTDNGKCLTDNYGWNKCLTYATAATKLHDSIASMKARYGGRLNSVMLYALNDTADPGANNDRENYFGALTADGSEKGAYTREVRSQLTGQA